MNGPVAKRVWPTLGPALTVATLLAAPGCTPDYGDSPFACAKSGLCPEGYYCGEDQVCHRQGLDAGSTDARSPGERSPEAQVPGDGGSDKPTDLVARDTVSPPLFEDDFSSAPGGLTQHDGTGSWNVAGGVLTQGQCYDSPDAIVPAKSWADVKVTAKVRGNTVCPRSGIPGAAGLLVRVVSIGADCKYKRYYYCGVDLAVSAGAVFVGKIDGDAYCAGAGFVAQPVGNVQLGVWYTMSFSAVGNVLTCSISGPGLSPTTAVFTDSGTPLASGSAGVLTDLATVSFDDFVVVAQ